MTKIVLCVRTPGDTEIQDWMLIDVPEIPAIGHYISVSRLDVREPLSEDYIVRRVWWRLRRADETDKASVGTFTEVFVECDVSCSPYATRDWQLMVRRIRNKGIPIEAFDTARITVGLGNYLSDDDSQ